MTEIDDKILSGVLYKSKNFAAPSDSDIRSTSRQGRHLDSHNQNDQTIDKEISQTEIKSSFGRPFKNKNFGYFIKSVFILKS